MEKCKFCQALLADDSTICPACGKDNRVKKATPGKIALAVVAVVVLAALLIAILVAGMGTVQSVEETIAAEVEVVATIPTDGNPADETAKGTYTAPDAEALAAAQEVVATMDGYSLTNGQLQVYYWMEVQNFLSQYGSYASYFGLDVTQRLDTQVCGIVENGETWQQFFLAGALNTWKQHQALAAEAEKAGFVLDEAMQAELDGLEDSLEQSALLYGLADAKELLRLNVGGAAAMEDYLHFMNLYYPGTMFFNEQVEANPPTQEEVEAYFTENEESFNQNGLTREDKYVDVRHVLIMPEGADSSNIRSETFDEAAWEASRVIAEELLAQFEQGDKSEESFAAMAVEYSQDGSAVDGGLYTDVAKGQMVENFENWCFDESRQSGDYGLVETEFGYHLMYFVSSRPMWVDYAESELLNKRANELLNMLLEQYTMEADFSKILLAYVDLDGEPDEEPSVPAVEEPALNEENTPVLWIAAASVLALGAVALVIRNKEEY